MSPRLIRTILRSSVAVRGDAQAGCLMFHGLRSSVSRRDLAREHDFAGSMSSAGDASFGRSPRGASVNTSPSSSTRPGRPRARARAARRPGGRLHDGGPRPRPDATELAAAVRLSPYHFLRVYKQAHQVTPGRSCAASASSVRRRCSRRRHRPSAKSPHAWVEPGRTVARHARAARRRAGRRPRSQPRGQTRERRSISP